MMQKSSLHFCANVHKYYSVTNYPVYLHFFYSTVIYYEATVRG